MKNGFMVVLEASWSAASSHANLRFVQREMTRQKATEGELLLLIALRRAAALQNTRDVLRAALREVAEPLLLLPDTTRTEHASMIFKSE